MLSVLVFLLTISPASRGGVTVPQTAPPPSKIDAPGELDKLGQSCGAFQVVGCAEELLTGQPVHVAIGSIAPQDGFSVGLAATGQKNTETWQINWDTDAVGSFNGSWRVGAYVRLVSTGTRAPQPVFGRANWTPSKANLTELQEHPVIGLAVQEISLSQLNYFGLGPATSTAGQAVFGMREFIGGAAGVLPFGGGAHASVYGEAYARSIGLSARTGQSVPTLGAVYDDTTAPGLSRPDSFAQLGEGARLRPVFWSDRIRLNYDVSLRHYLALNDPISTFHRLVIDLQHDVAIYSSTTRTLWPVDSNGPDQCTLSAEAPSGSCAVDTNAMASACLAAPSANAEACHAISRDLQGRISFRVLLSDSITSPGHVVPFYLQPTLGGSDINGFTALGSYADYRFRAPTLLLVRESIEHSVAGPIGATLIVDAGKVASRVGSLGSSPWLHSVSAGLTIRAGGAPEVYLLYSRGGSEGGHTVFTINTALLGGTPRPSLF